MADPAKGRPAPPAPPLWRQAFDSAERAVAPRAERLVRTSSFALGVGARPPRAERWRELRPGPHRPRLAPREPPGGQRHRAAARADRRTRPRGAATGPATGGRTTTERPLRHRIRRLDGGQRCPRCPARRRCSTASGATSSATHSGRVTASSWSPASTGPAWGRRRRTSCGSAAAPSSGTTATTNVRYGPPLLIVFSLISRSYILDLTPGNSFVEQLVDAGFDVYLLDWGEPDERDAGNGLEDYVDDYIPAGIDARAGALRRRRGQPLRLLLRRQPHPAVRRPPPRRPAAQPDGARDPGRLPAHGPPRRRLLRRAHGRRLRPRRRRQRAAVDRRPGVPQPDPHRRGHALRHPLGTALERRVRRLLPGDDRLVGRPRAVPRCGRAADGGDARARERDGGRPAHRRRRPGAPQRRPGAVPHGPGRPRPHRAAGRDAPR